MIADNRFKNQSLEFWANIRLLSQNIGYTERKTNKVKIPTIDEIIKEYKSLGLKLDHIVNEKHELTQNGNYIIDYFKFRADVLNTVVEPNLMKWQEAEEVFNDLRAKYDPKCPIPMNKQSGEMAKPAFFTGIINILIEAHAGQCAVNYNPGKLTSFTNDGYPTRTLSRRLDGAFPDIVNPVAIWEIKEYYYTTTFGSRIADGVYETQLDGMELVEVKKSLNIPVGHYLMTDAYDTWWLKGRSYLCRIVDMLHMGTLTEVLFGKEVITRLPELVKEWIEKCEALGLDTKIKY